MKTLSEMVLEHLKSFNDPKKAAEAYGLKEGQVTTAIRTKRPSASMMEKFVALQQGGTPESPEAEPPAPSTGILHEAGGITDELLRQFPTISEIISKVSEITGTLNEIITAFSSLGDRISGIEGNVSAAQSAIGQLQEFVTQLSFASGNGGMSPSSTVPQPTVERVDNGGDAGFVHPERISMTRTSRVAQLPVEGATPALPPVPTLSRIVPANVPPTTAPRPTAPASRIGPKFDWLSPHGQARPR